MVPGSPRTVSARSSPSDAASAAAGRPSASDVGDQTSIDAVVTMRRALSDTHLLGVVFGGDSRLAWRILLIAAMGEPLTERRADDLRQVDWP